MPNHITTCPAINASVESLRIVVREAEQFVHNGNYLGRPIAISVALLAASDCIVAEVPVLGIPAFLNDLGARAVSRNLLDVQVFMHQRDTKKSTEVKFIDGGIVDIDEHYNDIVELCAQAGIPLPFCAWQTLRGNKLLVVFENPWSVGIFERAMRRLTLAIPGGDPKSWDVGQAQRLPRCWKTKTNGVVLVEGEAVLLNPVPLPSTAAEGLPHRLSSLLGSKAALSAEMRLAVENFLDELGTPAPSSPGGILYEGGYTAVKEAVRSYQQRTAEVFMPLAHPPGETQADFGYAEIDWAGVRTQVALFVMTLPYSDAIFVCAFPRECTETFQEGHKRAFEFFGGVPARISYDNSKIAVIAVGKGRRRTLTDGFLRLQSHYLFAEHFCRVRRPNEKGHVETLVGFARRNFLVPVPKVDGIEPLNAHLAQCCRRDLSRTLRGKDKPKGALLEDERQSMRPLPATRFEAHRVEEARANSLSLVLFDRNDYSVPTEFAHHPVTTMGTIDQVRLVVNDRLAARHERCWDKERVFYDPVHYLALLERKPDALDFARPTVGWDLPPCFDVLRRRLEADLGDRGTREYIKVLRFLENTTAPQLARAVERALAVGATSADAIRLILEHDRQAPIALFSLDGRPHLKDVRVPNPDLSAYGALAESGR